MTLTQNNKAPTREEPTVETQTSNIVSPNSQQVIHMTVNGSARIQQVSSADEKRKLPNALGGGFSFGSPGGFGGNKVDAATPANNKNFGNNMFGGAANNVNHNMFGGGGFNGNNTNNGGGMGGGMFGNNNNNTRRCSYEQCDRSDVHTHVPANNMFGRNHRGGRGAGRGGGRAGGFGNTFGCVNTSNNTTPQFGCTTSHDAYNEKKWARFYERDPIRAATSGFTKAHYNAYLQKNFNNFDSILKCRYGSHCNSGSRCKFTHDTDSWNRPSKKQDNMKKRYASSGKGKDVCRKYRDTGTCNFGDECRFRHGDDGYDKRNLAKRNLAKRKLRSERKNKNRKKWALKGATFIIGLLALLFLGIYNQYNHEMTTHKQEDDRRLLLNWNKDLAVECNRRLDSSSIYSWSKYFVKDDVTKECENFEGK